MNHRILGIETSCDECSASVVEFSMGTQGPSWIEKSLSTYSQIELHRPYGGVVPEVASRNHLEQIEPVLREALKMASTSILEVDAIAVTNRPGLVGALLVGVTAAKALTYASKKPLIPVHHLEGHLMSPFLHLDGNLNPADTIPFPAIFLMVSGGHTQIHFLEQAPLKWETDVLRKSRLGRSLDDAAGEAFDKTAKTLGYPYPGGKFLDEAARSGDPKKFSLPRGLSQKSGYDFSFSGLKTAVKLLYDQKLKQGTFEADRADLCASIQEAIVDPLVQRSIRAAVQYQAKSIVVVGGVAANSRLRLRLTQESSVPVIFPNLRYCTDNAAMIAAAGSIRYLQGYQLKPEEQLKLNAFATAEI